MRHPSQAKGTSATEPLHNLIKAQVPFVPVCPWLPKVHEEKILHHRVVQCQARAIDNLNPKHRSDKHCLLATLSRPRCPLTSLEVIVRRQSLLDSSVHWASHSLTARLSMNRVDFSSRRRSLLDSTSASSFCLSTPMHVVFQTAVGALTWPKHLA